MWSGAQVGEILAQASIDGILPADGRSDVEELGEAG